MPPPLSHLDLYELCVQSPRHVVNFLIAAHANQPRILREDFSGSATISLRWIEEGLRRNEPWHAVAVDLDESALSRARSAASAANALPRLTLLHQDCLTATDPVSAPSPDVIFVGNFSIGYISDRPTLINYFRACHARLSQSNAGFGGGIFCCDIYGGTSAYTIGGLERHYTGPNGERVIYQWMHEHADPLTARVTNSISFRVTDSSGITHDHPRCFIYHWRLWSIAELREALLEAGFSSTEIHVDCNIPPGHTPVPITDPADLKPDYIVLIVARQ